MKKLKRLEKPLLMVIIFFFSNYVLSNFGKLELGFVESLQGQVYYSVLILLFFLWLLTVMIDILGSLFSYLEGQKEKINNLSSSANKFFNHITNLLSSLFTKARKYVFSFQKNLWFLQPDSIDSGMVEISIAVTSFVIAAPDISNSSTIVNLYYATSYQAVLFTLTMVNIILMNLYANNKLIKFNAEIDRRFIMFSPLIHFPFFILSWSLIAGYVMLAIIFAI